MEGKGFELRELLENTYIFSEAAGSYGELIACRAIYRADVGENIFKLLGIEKRECDFLLESRSTNSKMPVILRGSRDGKDTAVVFYKTAAYLPICFAIEVVCDSSALLRNTFGKDLQSACASSSARELLRYGEASEREAYDIAYQLDGISRACMSLFELREARPSSLTECAHQMARAAYVNLHLGEIDERPLFLLQGKVFVPDACFSVISAMMFAAREHSRDRALTLDIISDGGDMLIRTSFELYGGIDLDFCSYLREITSAYGCLISFYEKDGRLFCELDPFALDFGEYGLKHPENYFSEAYGE